ncbi:MAG: winged helix-turn-helix transcriptional regulator [Saprospiraceae bacterium]|nr:winged helix-turn-helix transcriptional regulator [Saprospiraceae bacterium]
MKQSAFNPEHQNNDLPSKIVAGLERISEVFKFLLWEKAKVIGLSPIQMQIIIFVAFHKDDLCNVSHLANEFNITKPTISDALKVLEKKNLIIKDISSKDSRSYTIKLTDKGHEVLSKIYNFSAPLRDEVNALTSIELESLYAAISHLIIQLHQNEILKIQRTCFTCRFYEKNDNSEYCNLLQQNLKRRDIRLDCPEHEERTNQAVL